MLRKRIAAVLCAVLLFEPTAVLFAAVVLRAVPRGVGGSFAAVGAPAPGAAILPNSFAMRLGAGLPSVPALGVAPQDGISAAAASELAASPAAKPQAAKAASPSVVDFPGRSPAAAARTEDGKLSVRSRELNKTLAPVRQAVLAKTPGAALDRLFFGRQRRGDLGIGVAGRPSVPGALKTGLRRADDGGEGRVFTPADLPEPSYDYARMFDLTRRILARPAARKFIKDIFRDKLEVSEEIQKEHGLPDRIKEISESQLMLILQYNEKHFDLLERYLVEMPEVDELDSKDPAYRELKKKWTKSFRDLLRNEGILDAFLQLNDPLKPMHLRTEDGSPGYRNVEIYSSHESVRDGAVLPADDLKRVIIDFIEGAEEEILFNVYEFNLTGIADALLRKADAGVKITGGIDQDEIHHQPGIQAVYEKLKDHKNITLHEVDSPGLNHQKMIVRDWQNKKQAKALFSSGNFTQSGIGPEGDLPGVPEAERPDYSIPNANHTITLESYLAAQVAANNLIKTLDYGMRGREYPLGGAFKIFGAAGKAAEDAPYMVLAFSPKGGLGRLNRDAVRRVLHESRGPIRMLQFVISSKSVLEALIERAKREIAASGVFDFKSVGDAPFALRPWSVFLAMSGLILDESKSLKLYKKMRYNPLARALGSAAFKELLKNIRIAPPEYGTNYFKREGRKTIRVSGILHHKVLVSGEFLVSGSFNFTDNAEQNNEHMIIFKDARMAARMTEIHDGLFSRTQTSVAEEAAARNAHEREKAREKKAKAKTKARKKRLKSRRDYHNRRGRESEEGEKEGRKK